MPTKHKEKLDKSILKYLYFSTFLLGLASAFILYLESDYFKKAAHTENITFFYLAAYGISLALIFNWHRLIRKFGKVNVLVASLSIKILASLALSFAPVSLWSAWFLVLYIIFSVMTWLDMDLLVESCSVDKKTGKIRGVYLTIMNLGYLFAPYAAGLLIMKYGFQAAFRVNVLILAGILFLALAKFKKMNQCQIENTGVFALLKKVFARKNVMRVYYVSFLLELFYALMIIYTPLYLLDLGFDWITIGKIFSFMLIPFVLFQYPAGYLADKKFEERDMMAWSLLAIGVSTALIYFIDSKSAVIWAIILFMTRIGASIIEILRDSYFYKRIDQRDVDVANFFRTVRPAAYIVGSLLAAPLIYFLGIRIIFAIIGITALTGIPACLSLASSRIPPKVAKH